MRAPHPAPKDARAKTPGVEPPAPRPSEPRLINDPHAPETFTTACCGLSIGSGTVTLTFESARCDHSDPACPMDRVVVGRMIMPVIAAQALVLQLNDALQRSGLSPSRAATTGMVAQ